MPRAKPLAAAWGLLFVIGTAGPAGGQGMFSPEYYIGYAADYSKGGKHTEAESYLRDCLNLNPNSGKCHFELAKTLMAQGKGAEAQTVLQKAYQLEAGLRARAGELATPAPGPLVPPPRPTAAGSTQPPDETLHTYKVGQTVEVSYAGGWHRGVLTKVSGSGRSVYVEANFTFQGDPRTGAFWYGGLRPAKGAYQPPAPRPLARTTREDVCQVRFNACFASSNRCSGMGGCQQDHVAQGMCRQQKILCDATRR